jgi:oligopeptide transport system ATP-binding protein
MNKPTLVDIRGLKMYFPFKDGLFKTRHIKAVDDISFGIRKGETFGLVGESGCGKSTTGRAILRLLDATEGKVYFEDKDIYALKPNEMLRLRKDMQIVFQDPFASLNPKLKVFDIIEEPLKFHDVRSGKERRKAAEEAMETVGLDAGAGKRYPHEFSGGQQQRIGIARALILKPKFIVCDEAVSALDVSVQAQVLNLLSDLKEDFGLTYLFISHNLSVVRHISDSIGVMYLGKIVEIGPSERIFSNPLHPYTKALISSIPVPEVNCKKSRIILEGDVPSPADPPLGCRFHTRCPNKKDACACEAPELKEIEDGHYVACIL